jgi:hypothetical protein
MDRLIHHFISAGLRGGGECLLALQTLSHRNVLRPLDGWNLKVKLSVEVGGKSLDFLPELLINTVHQNVIF